jgi:hypothetical protein
MEPLEDTRGIYLIIGVKHTFQTCIYFSRCLLHYVLAGKDVSALFIITKGTESYVLYVD